MPTSELIATTTLAIEKGNQINFQLESYLFTGVLLCYIIAFGLYCISSGFQTNKTYFKARIVNYAGLIMAFAALALRWANSGHAPVSNMYESLVTLSTFITMSGMLFTIKERLPIIEASSNVFSIAMLAISSLFPSEIRPLVPVLQSYWLPLHVSLAFLGESCFAVAVVLSYFYCYKRLESNNEDHNLNTTEKRLCYSIVHILPIIIIISLFALSYFLYQKDITSDKGKKLAGATVVISALMIIFKSSLIKKASDLLPNATKLDELTYNAIKIGYPLFTVGGLIFGMIWANKAWGRYWGWDPKETWALVTFLVYSIYLHLRIVIGKDGVIPAAISVLGFIVTMFTLFGVNFLISGLHSYA